MTRMFRSRAVAIGLGLVALSGAALAHHGITGEYDTSTPIILAGTIAAATFAPPHPILSIQVDGEEPARWGPFDSVRNLGRPIPAGARLRADPAYVAYNIAEFQRTGFHGGLNYYRAFQSAFDLPHPTRARSSDNRPSI